MKDYLAQNALKQICRKANSELTGINKKDKNNLHKITEILHRHYDELKKAMPEISYFEFTYTLGVINSQFPERD